MAIANHTLAMSCRPLGRSLKTTLPPFTNAPDQVRFNLQIVPRRIREHHAPGLSPVFLGDRGPAPDGRHVTMRGRVADD